MKNTVRVTENPAAEVDVIGCFLAEPSLIGEYADELTPDLFVDGTRRRAFEIIKAEYAERGSVTTADLVKKDKAVGDAALTWYAAFGGDFDVAHHIGLLKDAAARRHLQALAERVMVSVGAGEHPADTLAAIAEATVNIHAPYDTLPRLDLAKYREDMRADPEGWATGFDSLDAHVTLAPGSINYVTGATRQGKTTFLVNLAVNFLRNYQDAAALYLNLEVRGLDLVTKFITTLNGADGLEYNKVRSYLRGDLQNPEAEDRVETAIADLGRYVDRIHLKSGATLSAGDIARLIRAFAKARGPGLVLLDYVQLVAPERGRQDKPRYLELGDVSRALLAAAINYNVAIIAAVQAGRIEKAPTINDLRESGNFEQDAAVVLGLYLPPEFEDRIQIEVLKNRYGPDGQPILLTYHKPQGVMVDSESEAPVF